MSTQEKLSVLHVATFRENGGGTQSTLRWHHAYDALLGLAPAFLSIFDRRNTWTGECASLACHGWMSVGAVGQAFATAAARWPGSTVIYYDGWGLEWFAARDRAGRRLVYLQTERPNMDELLRRFAPLVDGFLCVSQGLADRVQRVLPEFPADRVCVPPFFVELPAWLQSRSEKKPIGRPIRLGYAGRIELGHKRLDRLPGLLESLDHRGVGFTFEVLGEGPYLPKLMRKLAGDPRVTFSGWCKGDAYWQKLDQWDVLVLVSDYEGFSRVTMDAMCCGVMPVHPNFSAAAGELLGPAAEHGLYETGDVGQAAERIAAYAELPSATIVELRRAFLRHFANHTGAKYGESYAEFMRMIAAAPRRANSQPGQSWANLLPLGIYTRLFPNRF